MLHPFCANATWDVDSGGLSEPCLRWRLGSPKGNGTSGNHVSDILGQTNTSSLRARLKETDFVQQWDTMRLRDSITVATC